MLSKSFLHRDYQIPQDAGDETNHLQWPKMSAPPETEPVPHP